MNCKQGDRAVLVRTSRAQCTLCGGWVDVVPAGTFVICEREEPVAGEPGWRVAKPVSVVVSCCRTDYVDMFGFRDRILRPIRDPGDDAVDETLIYAGDPRVREAAHG